MYFKLIFIIVLILLIIYLNKRAKETFIVTEAVQNIAKVYADASGSVMFNNINTLGNINTNGNITARGNIISNNMKIGGNIDISGNLDISGNTNINNNLYLAGTDIRTYLHGCSLVSMADSQSNSDIELHNKALTGAKLDLQIGYYSLYEMRDKEYDDVTDVIVVYPGFGVSAWEHSYTWSYGPGKSINIENYGTKPIKVNVTDGSLMTSTSLPNNVPNNINVLTTNDLYNNITSSYKITKSSGYTNLSNLISSVNVYLLPMSVWNTHVAPT